MTALVGLSLFSRRNARSKTATPFRSRNSPMKTKSAASANGACGVKSTGCNPFGTTRSGVGSRPTFSANVRRAKSLSNTIPVVKRARIFSSLR